MKAILVINAPDNINFEKLERAQISFYNKDTGNYIYRNARLKPLPNEKSHLVDSNFEDGCDYWEIEGYNQCLKEILGEQNDKERSNKQIKK